MADSKLPAALRGPTRAEMAGALAEQGASMSHELQLRCERCDGEAPLKHFRKNVACKACGGRGWGLNLTVTATTTESSGGIGTGGLVAANAIGLLSLAVFDAGFIVTGTGEETVTRKWRQSWSESGLAGSDLSELSRLSKKALLQKLLDLFHEQETRTRAALANVIRSEGVHCLGCRELFPPSSALARRKLRPLTRFSTDEVCSSKCQKAIHAVKHETVCPVCEKAFVPPAPSQIKRDWQPKEWHTAGYCTRKCFEARDRKRTCPNCEQPFVIPTAGPLARSRGGAKRWHEQGYCSKRCLEGKPPLQQRKRPQTRQTAAQVAAACPQGHASQVPATHRGYLALCPTCHTRFQVG